MTMEPKRIISILVFILLIAIVLPELPKELTEDAPAPIDNETYPAPLMSTPDDNETGATDTKPGWWKHTGHSTVAYSRDNEPNSSLSTEDYDIDIRIMLDGQDAATFPGPSFVSGSEVNISYMVINSGSSGLIDVCVTDDNLGDIGECDFLNANASTTFEHVLTVQEGNFSSTGRVSGLSENSLQMCSDQSQIYYSGVSGYEEIPEFPSVFLPVSLLLAIAFVFARKKI